MKTRYFVVFAPGHYGDTCKVLSSHYTYRRAIKAIQDTTTLVIREGNKRKGETFTRASESIYPYATDTRASQTDLIAGYMRHL